jgi:hypothetical protein
MECTTSRIHHRIDKGEVPMVHCLTGPFGESGAGVTVRPRGMETTRPNSAARAKELGENKGVADNGLTNTNEHILPTTNDDPR